MMDNETTLLRLRNVGESFFDTRSSGMAAKRFFDFVFALIACVIFFVPCIFIAAAIWAEDRHSPFFRQERIGLHGRRFMLYKFRSMRIDAERENGPALYHENDERLTRVGRFIREHHLDEFPQLINVLRGDMSFVGYRPERRFFIERISEKRPDYERLFAIRPGLFSYATLYNGYTDTLEKMITRLDMDLDYLGNRSLMVDVSIIAKTSLTIISGKKF